MNPKTLVYRLVASGLPVLAKFRPQVAADSVAIIMVHGVHDESEGLGRALSTSSVSLKSFEANILALSRVYSFVSMDDVVAMLTGNAAWRTRCLTLTFDDSLKSHTSTVAPKLVRWGIPATFYISTEVIETQRPYWWMRLEYAVSRLDGQTVTLEIPERGRFVLEASRSAQVLRELKTVLRGAVSAECERAINMVESQLGVSPADLRNAYPHSRVMTWKDVKQLKELGMTIGSHTVTHPNLTLLSGGELRLELESSRNMIEQQCQTSCRHLCYPYGAHSDSVCEAARAAGYASAVTTVSPGWNQKGGDVFRLRRFAMSGEPYKLCFLLSGLQGLSNTRRGRGARYSRQQLITTPGFGP